MTNGHEPNKTTTPGANPLETTYQPPQFRILMVSGLGGFLGALLGALLACHFCMHHT